MYRPAHHLLFHFVLQNETEQHMVGNWSKIRILVLPSAHSSLFHVVLQHEIEQQIVGNWSNIRILVAFAHHVLFHFVLHNEKNKQWWAISGQ